MKKIVSFFLALIMIMSIASVCFAAKRCPHDDWYVVDMIKVLSSSTEETWTTNCTKVPGHNHKHTRTTFVWKTRCYCDDCDSYFIKEVPFRGVWICSYGK